MLMDRVVDWPVPYEMRTDIMFGGPVPQQFARCDQNIQSIEELTDPLKNPT